MDSMDPVIEVQGAAKSYADGTQALAPVDLTVREREFLTLIGPSGCGKSTLLKMMAGLLPPSAGSVRLWGEPAETHARQTELQGDKLAFVFQEATLMPWRRIVANVRLPLDLAGSPRAEANRRVGEALDLVGLAGFEKHFPRQLSGGMQMRASIARALVNDPNLLLMDEPFGALDEITRARLDSDLLDLWRRRGLSIVFVTHSVYEAVFLSTRVAVMAARPGRVVREVVIDEPFPRAEAFRVSAKFLACCQELSQALGEASTQGAAGHSPVAVAS